jgi:signal transduction histidine kinase
MRLAARYPLLVPLATVAWLAGVGVWSLQSTTWALMAVAVGGWGTAFIVTWRLGVRLRRLEGALRKSGRMRVLGQVSSGLAHQLRNAVAGAKLATQLHARSCEFGDDESLDVALRQLARVEGDLARFLDLGRDDVPRRPCHLVELVEEAVALLRPQCRHADVQLCWEPPAADPVVLGDPGRLSHVVVNLVSNAIEAAGPGGQVEVAVEPAGDADCLIGVWDTGPGPAAAVAERLCEPFVTGKADGVGLGLFVARQAAEAHGGRLGWRREAGRTCFWVELPAGRQTVQVEPAALDVSL